MPFKTIAGINWTFRYFYTQDDAEGWADATKYRTMVSKVSLGCFEVAEHYYEKKV